MKILHLLNGEIPVASSLMDLFVLPRCLKTSSSLRSKICSFSSNAIQTTVGSDRCSAVIEKENGKVDTIRNA